MKLLLYHGISWPSWIIRKFFWQANETHAAIELQDGRVIEAAWFKAKQPSGKLAKRGVRYLERWDVGHKGGTVCDVCSFRIDEEQTVKMLWFLTEQLGKPYDLRGLLGFFFRRHVEHPGKWFCSELVAASAKHAGLDMVPGREPYQVAPFMLKMNQAVVRYEETRVVGEPEPTCPDTDVMACA